MTSLRQDLLSRLERLAKDIAETRKLHGKFGIYDECGHDHKPEDCDDEAIVDIEEVGVVCEDGLIGTVCKECDTDDGEVDERTYEGVYPCEARRYADILGRMLARARAEIVNHRVGTGDNCTGCPDFHYPYPTLARDCPVLAGWARDLPEVK